MFLLSNITAFISLVIASITDIKTREVPDWLNYGLIIFGLGSRLIYSIALLDISFFLYGLAGFFVFFVIANLMFYSAQWGGGDSKLLMGLGAVIGLNFNFKEMPFLLIFWINIILIGAIYGLFWSFVLAFKNKNRFLRDFRARIKKSAKIRKFLLIISLAVLLSAFFIDSIATRVLLVILVFSSLLIYYISIFVKSVERTCMLKYVEPEKLTEGDWIAKNVIIKKKRICGPKDLGIEKKQIKQLINLKRKGLIKKILIKEGIPFVPIFLVAFIVTLLFGNWLLLFI
ncbi:MAG: A24 family peptidase [Nanoarchaeota archaeon]|nr:A24 family peptidase [Nanoarchaeota archaeon]